MTRAPDPRPVPPSAWPARVSRLGDEPPQDLSASTTVAERLDMLVLLTRRAWELAGRPWPTVPRREWTASVMRGR